MDSPAPARGARTSWPDGMLSLWRMSGAPAAAAGVTTVRIPVESAAKAVQRGPNLIGGRKSEAFREGLREALDPTLTSPGLVARMTGVLRGRNARAIGAFDAEHGARMGRTSRSGRGVTMIVMRAASHTEMIVARVVARIVASDARMPPRAVQTTTA
jgi:hypothetical protein